MVTGGRASGGRRKLEVFQRGGFSQLGSRVSLGVSQKHTKEGLIGAKLGRGGFVSWARGRAVLRTWVCGYPLRQAPLPAVGGPAKSRRKRIPTLWSRDAREGGDRRSYQSASPPWVGCTDGRDESFGIPCEIINLRPVSVGWRSSDCELGDIKYVKIQISVVSGSHLPGCLQRAVRLVRLSRAGQHHPWLFSFSGVAWAEGTARSPPPRGRGVGQRVVKSNGDENNWVELWVLGNCEAC